MPCAYVLLIINNTVEPRASDGQFHTFTTRHGQDDARKGSSNRPVGQPKEGSKTPIWQARNHSNKQPQRIFQHLASTIALRTHCFSFRMCMFFVPGYSRVLMQYQPCAVVVEMVSAMDVLAVVVAVLAAAMLVIFLVVQSSVLRK